MPVVQKLYDACKASFSTNGPISEEALGKVCAILGVVFPHMKLGNSQIVYLCLIEVLLKMNHFNLFI